MARTAFITGTNSGIGLATAHLFARNGWNVIATMRRMELSGVFAGSPNVRVIPLELCDPASIAGAVELAISTYGRVDVLVNNAGAFHMGPLEGGSLEQIRAQFEINFFGPVALTKALLPHLRAHPGATVVNVGSVSAENGYPFAAAYSASKAALVALSEALNIELDPVGITVKAVLPGLHATKIFTKLDMAEKIPAAYRPLFDSFIAQQRSTKGSRPECAAGVIYQAATDGQRAKVRYFAGRDATAVPRAKRMLGHSCYFWMFRKALLAGPSKLTKLLTPRGQVEVEVDLSQLPPPAATEGKLARELA